MDKLVYSIKEVAEVLGISRSYAYQLVKEKRLPVIELGKRKIISKVSLELWLQNYENIGCEESR